MNNGDLISRSALLNEYRDFKDMDCPSGHTVTADYMIELVEDAPAVDAAPVRHGYWKSRANFLECSECGREFTQYDWEGSVVAYYYCPNCGAKMHVEVEV